MSFFASDSDFASSRLLMRGRNFSSQFSKSSCSMSSGDFKYSFFFLGFSAGPFSAFFFDFFSTVALFLRSSSLLSNWSSFLSLKSSSSLSLSLDTSKSIIASSSATSSSISSSRVLTFFRCFGTTSSTTDFLLRFFFSLPSFFKADFSLLFCFLLIFFFVCFLTLTSSSISLPGYSYSSSKSNNQGDLSLGSNFASIASCSNRAT
mmetsp:Transcript_10619/g.19820  ORF Transcript_10619/g.19820 Transcript_10619/m.19820 type:complete len:205 (-) Transcript_10619:1176-1790(-)